MDKGHVTDETVARNTDTKNETVTKLYANIRGDTLAERTGGR